ncbi:hypothetical protein RI367_004820 [Sorochytrium milnesiophthora]
MLIAAAGSRADMAALLLVALALCLVSSLLPAARAGLPPPTTTQPLDDLFDPKYFASQFTLQSAPIAPVRYPNGTLNVCKYVSTPRNGSNKYDCDAGFFCPFFSSNQKTQCSGGFYCPPNTAQPLYCCEGYFCSTPDKIEACPQGHYCPQGSERPLPCHFIASCPVGTSSPKRVGVFGVVAVFMLFAFGFFAINSRVQRSKLRKLNKNMSQVSLVAASAAVEGRDKYSRTLPRRSLIGKQFQTFDIQFANLGYTLPNGTQLMSNVSGELKAGRLCAIMGPSGSGKSTFVNLLTGKTKRTKGSVSVNGMEGELGMYKKLIGFVPQEDIMIRELTVLDTLMHSARTRLPSSWSTAQVKAKVLETTDFLGLRHVMNNTIGDEVTRGLSGGQRKRVNIGMELVAEPSVLFLDEPTSGLDSSTSYELCCLLQNIAREQLITIGAVIHSPSPASFEKFDDLLILAEGGRLIYFGERSFAVHYFKALGFEIPPHVNVADFMIDVASGKIKSVLYPGMTPYELTLAWQRYTRGDSPEPLPEHASIAVHPQHAEPHEFAPQGTVAKFFHDLKWHAREALVDAREYVIDVSSEFGGFVKSFVKRSKDPVRETPNGFFIFWLCFRRACFQIYRSPSRFVLDQMLHLGCGAFISIASENLDYLGQQPDEICQIAPAALQPFCRNPIDELRQVGVFMSLGVLFAGISTSIATFGNERVVYWREFGSGQCAIPYFFGKMLADLSRVVVASFMFSLALITVWPYRSNFLVFWAISGLLYYSAFAMGYFISTFVNKESAGLVATGMALAWSIVFSGVVPSLENVKRSGVYDGVAWIWSLSPPRYAVEALYIKEVEARPFPENKGNTLRYTYQRSDFALCMVAIFAIGTAWHLLSLITMKLVNRDRMK